MAVLCCAACSSQLRPRPAAAPAFCAEKAEERKREQSILYERQLAKERAAEVRGCGSLYSCYSARLLCAAGARRLGALCCAVRCSWC